MKRFLGLYYAFFLLNICACAQNENMRRKHIYIYPYFRLHHLFRNWTSNDMQSTISILRRVVLYYQLKIEENHLAATAYMFKIVVIGYIGKYRYRN